MTEIKYLILDQLEAIRSPPQVVIFTCLVPALEDDINNLLEKCTSVLRM